MLLKRRFSLFIFLILLLNGGCVQKYFDFTLETDAIFQIPFVHGSYLMNDVFEDFDGVASVNTGKFYEFTDTLAISDSSLFNQVESLEIIFTATNFIPFQVDLMVTFFDSISNTNLKYYNLTVVEPAILHDQLGISIPTSGSSHFIVDKDLLVTLEEANALIVSAEFIWPYEAISAELEKDWKAFDLNVILKTGF